MVLSRVSLCLSAPAPSPASFMVVISVCYLLVPFVSREEHRVSLLGFPAGWDQACVCVFLQIPSPNALASHCTPVLHTSYKTVQE